MEMFELRLLARWFFESRAGSIKCVCLRVNAQSTEGVDRGGRSAEGIGGVTVAADAGRAAGGIVGLGTRGSWAPYRAVIRRDAPVAIVGASLGFEGDADDQEGEQCVNDQTSGTPHFASIARIEGFGKAGLEMESDGRGDGARRHIVGSAEGREEVVQRFLVGQIDDCQARAPFISVAVEDVVVADGGVEKAPG